MHSMLSMSTLSIQISKQCYILCIEQGILFVDTVDTKIKAMLLCYCVLSRVSCLSTLSIQRSKHPMHLMLCLCRHCRYKDQRQCYILCIEQGILFVDTVDTKIKASNAFNAMFMSTLSIQRSKQCYCVLSRVSCLSTLSIQRSKHPMHLMLCSSTLSTLVFVAL